MCDHEEQVEDVCAICTSGTDLIKTLCRHEFHLHCLLDWNSRQARKGHDTLCPICRAVLIRGEPIPRFIRTGHNNNTNNNSSGAAEDDTLRGEVSALLEMLMSVPSTESSPQRLVQAIHTANLGVLRTLLNDSPELVNAKLADNMNPLLLAVYRRQAGAIDILLQRGANPRLADRFGITPLHACVSVGHLACARKLLNKGACVELQDKNGETPLFCAVRAEDAGMVALLLHKGANVNAENAMGDTIFHLIAQGDVNRQIVSSLRRAEPTCLNSPNHIGDIPLHIAVEHCNVHFIRKFKALMTPKARFVTNHLGFTAEDYLQETDAYEPIRRVMDHWTPVAISIGTVVVDTTGGAAAAAAGARTNNHSRIVSIEERIGSPDSDE